MHTTLDAPPVSTALFHSHSGGFPLLFCTYALLDENGNDTANLDRLVVIRVTALNGERFRLHDPGDTRRFLAVIGHISDGVEP